MQNLELDLGLDSMQRVELLVAWSSNWAEMWKSRGWQRSIPCANWWTPFYESAAAGGAGTTAKFAGWETILQAGSRPTRRFLPWRVRIRECGHSYVSASRG